MNTRRCLADGCGNVCYYGRLLCAACWALVPQILKDALYRAHTPGQWDGKAEPTAEWVDLARKVVKSAEQARKGVVIA